MDHANPSLGRATLTDSAGNLHQVMVVEKRLHPHRDGFSALLMDEATYTATHLDHVED